MIGRVKTVKIQDSAVPGSSHISSHGRMEFLRTNKLFLDVHYLIFCSFKANSNIMNFQTVFETKTAYETKTVKEIARS